MDKPTAGRFTIECAVTITVTCDTTLDACNHRALASLVHSAIRAHCDTGSPLASYVAYCLSVAGAVESKTATLTSALDYWKRTQNQPSEALADEPPHA